jgi:hypothetical protein
MSDGKKKEFIVTETSDQVNRYIDEICADPKFLCSNKELCAKSSTLYANIDNIKKICSDITESNKCENDFSECLVNTENKFDEERKIITTSFVNIILPIVGAFDESANQKFLRLPALSSSKKPKSQDICNICACMNRFSTSPGSSAVINENSYTSPGQNTCIYPDFIEHYYYPVSMQNINEKLKESAPTVNINKYKIINSNIIFAHSEEELGVGQLYDLLTKNGIAKQITINFILNVLYKNDEIKKKELMLYIANKQNSNTAFIKNGEFYTNMAFFYTLLGVFLFLLIVKVV